MTGFLQKLPAVRYEERQHETTRMPTSNADCEQWSDDELEMRFCEQYAGNPDTARAMLAATRQMYDSSYGPQLGRLFWRASVCGILKGQGGNNSLFVPLRALVTSAKSQIETDSVSAADVPASAPVPAQDPRIGTRLRLINAIGSPLWPAESRLAAGAVVQVFCIDEDDPQLLGVFLPDEPLRGGADLGRGVGGWWLREHLLVPVPPPEPPRRGPGRPRRHL